MAGENLFDLAVATYRGTRGRQGAGVPAAATSEVGERSAGPEQSPASLLKRLLDLGARNVLLPVIHPSEQAEAAVRAVCCPPRGNRGIGSAVARSARRNRVDDYLGDADHHVPPTFMTPDGAAVTGPDGRGTGSPDIP
ncbi:hypothetical protein SNE510_62940 [Streptomyces sp. NE5-10]|uniref:hypothetical protein n=1 Tax=Streptomyces sp. NE5-10 TaxID=2759674 RepID=UPI00190424D9|nr:hypothetical protein [Streptomyces sp. NE5-10]GHJ96775.1 hypothetical protein SNE510_62940 [Streptomyces sp. NE5-10]